MPPLDVVTRAVLAHHLDCDVSMIHPWQDLEDDLELTPLEIVTMALDIEEIEEVRLPIEELAGVRTVGELQAYLARALDGGGRFPHVS